VKEAEAATVPSATGGRGKEVMSNADLAKLIVVKPVSGCKAALMLTACCCPGQPNPHAVRLSVPSARFATAEQLLQPKAWSCKHHIVRC
jgi:hypothetical protein